MTSFACPMEIRQRKTDLFCVGELLVDMIATKYGNLIHCETFGRFAGGSPANIASNARKLGLSAAVAAAVGSDGFGDYLLDGFEREGLDASLVQRCEESTSLVVISRSRDTPVPIFYRGADYHIVLTPAIESRLQESSIFHFSCWPLSMEPARSTVKSMIRIARAEHSLVCFDPNYHPMVWRNNREAISFIEALMPDIDIVKPSEDDANRLFGADDPVRHMRRFLALGAKLVIMTLGRDGAIASDGSETREYPSLADNVADTTGAGDAFWSGLYAGLIGKRSIDRSILIGMAVCARKLRCIGSKVPKTSLVEIESDLGTEERDNDGLRQ
jgi:sugar/nucleoside kinase (ribokinase family)